MTEQNASGAQVPCISLLGSIEPSEIGWEYATPTPDDAVVGDAIAYHAGDTFIDPSMPPTKQWERIAMMLRVHGVTFTITPNTTAHLQATTKETT